MANRNHGNDGRFVRTEQHAENDAKAVRLKTSGASYPAIARALGYASPGSAYKAVQRALAAIPAPDVEELRALQGAELDALRLELWQVIHGKHYKVSNSGRVVMDPATGEPLLDPAPKIAAGNALRGVLDRQAKLFGLDMPTKVEAAITVETAMDVLEARIAELNVLIAAEERKQQRKQPAQVGPPRWLPELPDGL